jgi:manganese-dependent inorganic pyrophosphatase
MPIYIDIRPWGSMSTIIAHNFFTLGRRPKRATAGLLLCAILSDTLNLQGPTTTEWDRLIVAVLAELVEVDDIQLLASKQFKAKSSELAFLSSYDLINGDQKIFTFKTEYFDGIIGFAVIETTDDEVILNRTPELLLTLSEDKEKKQLNCLFLAIVNIVQLKTNLLLCSENEISLAKHAFHKGKLLPVITNRGSKVVEENEETKSSVTANSLVNAYSMDLGSLVSRKKDFIPAITSAIKKGWSLSMKVSNDHEMKDASHYNEITRVRSVSVTN